MAEYEDETVPSILLPCTSCSRTFRPEALAKHTKYCEKTLIKKRKVFDSAKQRIQGTDLAEFLPVLTHKKKVEKSPIRKTQSKWKEKHMELVRAIRAARVGSSSEELPPAPVKPSDHEKCPHCDRYFGPKAYDRHLEWCKEHSTRIQPKSPASIQAKERLEARTKYRAPVLAKSRRTVTKEKYQLQGNRIRDPSPKETTPKNVSNRLRDPSPMERNKNIHSSQVSLKQPAGLPKGESNVIDSSSRLQLHRSSRRHPSPMKKTSVTVRSRNSESTKNISVQKELSHLTNRNINNLNSFQDNDDIFSASCNISSVQPLESPKPKLKVASNTTSASHNSVVPIPAEACELQHLKRRYIRKEKPILNSIHVNDDIAGMTVYACRPASVITDYTSQNLNNCNKKENCMEENTDESKKTVSLGSTCISRVIRGIDLEEECSIKSLTVESVESMDVNYCPFVDERKSDNKSDISILSYTSSVAKESCSNVDQPDVVCPLNSFSDLNKNTHVTLSKDIASDGVAGTYDYDCINFEEGSKNGLKDSSWDLSLQDCLIENNLLINSCVDLASMNMTQKACVSESFSDNKDFIADKNGCNNSSQFDDYINRSSTPKPQVKETFDLEDIPKKKNYNNVESLIYSCDSLDNSLDKIPKTVFDDDFSSPVKRRRCDSQSDLSQLVDVLFISDRVDFNKSSVCSDYNTSKENDISNCICEKDSAKSPKNCVINNNKYLHGNNDLMNMDMELCMDCQRSKSDSDLYNFNNNVLKCCYERKARMCKLQQTFLMPNHKSEIERFYSDDSEEHESFNENEASNTEKKNSSELNNLQKNNTEFIESEMASFSDEWKKVRSSTFVVGDKDIKNFEDINQNFMYHRYSDTAIDIINKNDSFITAALPNFNQNTNDMLIKSSQKKSNNELNLCSSSMAGDKLNYDELDNDYFVDNSQIILCDANKTYPEEQIFDIKTMYQSPKSSEIDIMCKRVNDDGENCEAIKKNRLSDGNEIYPFEIEEFDLKDNCSSFEGAGNSISADEFSSSEEIISHGKVEPENSLDNKNRENLPNFENNINAEKCLQSEIPLTGSNINISIVDLDTPEFIFTNKYADYKNCKKVVVNNDSYSDMPCKHEMFCNDENVSIASEIQEECVCHMVEALNCEPELNMKNSFDYCDVENSDNVREFLSDSLYNTVECFEYSASEECYVSFRTEISHVENHQIWRENYLDDDDNNNNNQGFLTEHSESFIEHSFLPPLKIKLPKKPTLKTSLKEAFKNIKMKNSHLISNSSTKNPKIPKLTTWQMEAEKDQTFPPVKNFYSKKNYKLNSAAKPLKLPQLTVMRRKCNQINKSINPSKLPQLIMNGENVFYQKAIGSEWSRVVLPRVVKHVVTAILPKRFPVVSLENYDPYKSAERQMKELLGLEDDITAEIHHEEEDNKETKEQISCISQKNIISSPTSAFAKFSPIEPARSPDFLENDFIPPPEKFDSIQNQLSHSITESDCIKDKNQNPISLSSLSLCSTISIDSVDSYKNSFRKGISTSAKVQSCDKKVALPLKRSISAVEPHRKGRNFLKSNLKMEHLLFGFPADNYDRFLGTPINDINPDENKSLESLSLSNESLKRSDSVEETSRAEQELLKSMSEFEKLFESPLKPVPPLIPSSNPTPVPLPHGDMNNSSENSKPETQQLSTGNKFSTDSAYNSLNRKSPQMNDLVGSENEDNSQLIASGGTEGSFKSPASQNSHAARFCHECGSKYPVLAAKFCCHCGVRRLII